MIRVLIMYAICYVLGFYRRVNVKLMEELRSGRFFIKTQLTEFERRYLTTGGGIRKNPLTVCWEPKSDAESALSEPIVRHANA